MSVPLKAQKAVDAATTSCERVVERARTVTKTISQRNARARTDPFLKVEENEFDQEDSLVTSIENVIAASSPTIEVEKKEE